jgi:hypothetical protein
MRREESSTETESAEEQAPEKENGRPPSATPPIDEDVAGSVNAAVPDHEES